MALDFRNARKLYRSYLRAGSPAGSVCYLYGQPVVQPVGDANPFRRAEWDKHLLYIYRIEPGLSTPVDKCAGYLDMSSGAQVPINDREEVESPPDATSSA